MAKFVFEAKAANGRETRVEVEANSEAEARVKLRAQKMVPIRVLGPLAAAQMQKKKQGPGSVKAKDLQIFTRQLATLIGSGIPILQAMDTLAQGSRSSALTYAVKQVAVDISRGKRLAEAMGEHPKVFNRFFVNMVRAGEESGNLDVILGRLAQYIEKSVKLQGKVKSALMYPTFVIIIAFLVVVGLLTFVIPKFQSFFESVKGELPALTQFVIMLSNFFMAYWYFIFAAIGGTIYALVVYYQTDQGRKVIDKLLIEIPLFGELFQKSAVARFTRTLATLLSSGVGIMDALDIAARTVGNTVVEEAILRARDSISEGKSLTIPLAKERYIPKMVVQMIGVGEQTGNLDQMLSRVADFYEDEVDVAVGGLTTIIEPVLIVGLGVVIAVLVIAMYLPIFNMADVIGPQ